MPPKTALPVQQNSQKRKAPSTAPAARSHAQNKRFKTIVDARTISAQTTSKAFKNGELDVDKFVKAREYEIRALEEGLDRSKKALSKRAFQQVPKELRRRTASHNAKRVPKKLQGRAKREMAEDNTPTVAARRRKPSRHQRLRIETVKRLRAMGATRKKAKDKAAGEEIKILTTGDTDVSAKPSVRSSGTQKGTPKTIKSREPRIKKNVLKDPPPPKARFRKRQLHKSWLPTHLFHAKRAHMTPPKEPLWRFAIPITSTAKSYRPTHRASSQRGAVAWDMSYMATIGLEGTEKSIEGLLRAFGVGAHGNGRDPFGLHGKRWRNGTRVWQGWLYERDRVPSRLIGPATVIWRAEEVRDEIKESTKKPKRAVMVRVHPSIFHQLWVEVVRMCKIQKPQVIAEDLRFELGSIEITGPGSTEALLGALWPVNTDHGSEEVSDKMGQVWKSLRCIENPAVLPHNALLAFSIQDPRLHHPPRTVKADSNVSPDDILRMLADWPCDEVRKSPAIFDRNIRMASTRALASQGAINRRKGATKAGSYPDALPTDPRIPILLYAGHGTCSPSAGSQATWTLMLPWKAVLPIWHSIMYYPLSTGGQVRFGGLDEQRQIAFEAGVPWFPGDFVGTEAGDRWEEKESARRKKEWERRPKGKRTEFSSVMLAPNQKGEIGEGWACDWDHLLKDMPKARLHKVPPRTAQERFTTKVSTSEPVDNCDLTGVVNVRITLLSRGVPCPCARIYRLPLATSISSAEIAPALRDRWLALLPTKASSRNQRNRKQALPPRLPRNAPIEVLQQQLAAELLQPAPVPGHKPREDVQDYPSVPAEEDLIGFVTTGEFCLSEGKGVGIGSVLLHKVLESENAIQRSADDTAKGADKGHRICIVRNAGESLGRLAKWEIV